MNSYIYNKIYMCSINKEIINSDTNRVGNYKKNVISIDVCLSFLHLFVYRKYVFSLPLTRKP